MKLADHFFKFQFIGAVWKRWKSCSVSITCVMLCAVLEQQIVFSNISIHMKETRCHVVSIIWLNFWEKWLQLTVLTASQIFLNVAVGSVKMQVLGWVQILAEEQESLRTPIQKEQSPFIPVV